ncbi:MAG: tRNA (N6-threonylcarbamoyladenosine(37)-N6)-methyltransferase TrmO [Anaerolineae bacterium]|nr:tRNA (N6-threonylcarbamoyladenosine(37)-N6)-methyltransferase TrmO [Anaerolineae bacterium]
MGVSKDRAIGTVTVGVPRPGGPSRGRGAQSNTIPSEITIDAAWSEALDGIEGFSHIWVVWWIDRFDEPPEGQHVHPEGRPEMPLVGLFATRSPHRPCPVGITAVRLLERKGRRLVVEGLDAFEGTHVLDIKPYLRRGDLVSEASAPEWLERLWQIHDAERGE